MMQKILLFVLALILAGSLAACGREPGQPAEAVESTAALSETEPARVLSNLPETDFEQLQGLLGLDDAQAAGYFGSSEENWTEDKRFFIGRIYQVSLLGQPAAVYTSYSSENTVASVSAWVTDGSRAVTEDEAQTWIGRIADYAGSDPVYSGVSPESGSQSWKWEKDGVFLTIHWLGDIITIELLPAVGELH